MGLFSFGIATNTNNLPFGFVYGQDMSNADAAGLTWTLSSTETAFFQGSIVFFQNGMRLSDVVDGLVQSIRIGNVAAQDFTLNASDLNISAVSFFTAVKAGAWQLVGQILTAGDDQMEGSAFKDRLYGGLGADRIDGGAGGDRLSGGAGNDWLSGALGNDTLTGGGGRDVFSFTSALNATKNFDKITDFKPGFDHFELVASPVGGPFNALSSLGALMDSEFLVGTAATTRQQHILYDQATGTVFYDPDGSASSHAIAFAHVTPGLVLHATDFLVV